MKWYHTKRLFITIGALSCVLMLIWCKPLSEKYSQAIQAPSIDNISSRLWRVCRSQHAYIEKQVDSEKECIPVWYAYALDTRDLITARHIFDQHGSDTAYFVHHPTQGTRNITQREYIDAKDLAYISTWFDPLTTSSVYTSQEYIRSWAEVSTYLYASGASLAHAIHWHKRKRDKKTGYLMHTIPLQAADSWSPLFSQSGTLIWINTAIAHDTTQTSYALMLKEMWN